MHPIFATRYRMLQYLGAWLVIAELVLAVLHYPGHLSYRQAAFISVPLCLFYGFVCLSPWYLCEAIPLASQRLARILVSHGLAAFVAGTLWIWLAQVLTAAVVDPGVRDLRPHLAPIGYLGVLMYLLSSALHYLWQAFEMSREAERKAQQAALLAREAELKALKAQINPHFLFNSLNSISALTAVDPAKAREMCVRLSDFLRNTLNMGNRETIPFSEELALTRTYLGIEQIRFGARLKLTEAFDQQCGSCPVPPLLMQPLVENAVKHGVAGLLEGGTIRLAAQCADRWLRVQVENEFDSDAPVKRNGVGLANVRDRLKTRYEDQARLDTRIDGNCFKAELTLPCEAHGKH